MIPFHSIDRDASIVLGWDERMRSIDRKDDFANAKDTDENVDRARRGKR